MGGVVTSKPDFIDAVVERDDSLFQNRFANIGNQTLRIDWKTIVVSAFGDVLLNVFGDFFKSTEIPM